MAASTASGPEGDVEPIIIVGSRHGTVTALGARTGAALWSVTTGPRLGTLAHDGERVYVPTTLPVGTVRRLNVVASGRSGRVGGYPALLTALGAQDGGILWQREGWSIHRTTQLCLDGGMLLADAPAPGIGDALVYGLDPRTGDIRWAHDTGLPWGFMQRLIAAGGGRAFVWEEHESRTLSALNARTGNVLWRHERPDPQVQLSPEGKLVVVGTNTAPAGSVELTVRNAVDGSVAATLLSGDRPIALTDDGIAYVPRYPNALVAVRIGERAERWRARDIEPGHLLVTDDVLYCAWLTQPPRQLAVVAALDAHSGQQLWRWHSPAHLVSLLRLWGRRTPQVIVFALSRARRSIQRARDQHDRSIVQREVIHGQWRRPASLLNDFQIAAGWGIVFVATSMGLFALRADDGRLLWHALPTRDLSWHASAVSPG
ncbi:MAG TPA: PQQ-binding-like beta-propeller repeat protein [Ktedonobacterales bacterium]|nr:PQQ-binding-like beta-propeller repeat protein [Ktedonobacterales bacterium]